MRNKFGAAMVPFITIITGLAITFIPSSEEQRIVLYQIFFCAAFVIGLFEITVFKRFKIAPVETGDEAPALNFSVVGEIIKNKQFRSFFLPVLGFVFFWQAGWPLYSIFQVSYIRASEFWFAVFALITGLSAFLSAGFWQKFIRKRGNTRTMIFAASFLVVNTLVFSFAPNVYFVALLSPIGGFATIGINTALLNGVLEVTPAENRLPYLAFYNTTLNISLFIAPFFAHTLLTNLGLHPAFLIVAACRALGAVGIAVAMKR
jgi:MFS family permease